MQDKIKQAAEAAGKMHPAYADLNTLKHMKFYIEEMRRMQKQLNDSITRLHDSRTASKLREAADKIDLNANSLDWEITKAESLANSRSSKAGEELYSLLDE